MSEKAQQFVDDWIDENVHPTGYEPEGNDSEARQYADACSINAEAQEISRADIKAAVGNLVAYMASAIERKNDEEVQRRSDKDG